MVKLSPQSKEKVMYQNGSEIKILVKNRPIDLYRHQNKFYVEGRKGSPYEIQYRNHTGKRQRIVLSVDGLNVMTGDATWDRAYCVEPYGIIVIPGWRKDASNVAKFIFSSLKGSYNQHNESGQARNIGVIGCRVYNEKIKPQHDVIHHHWNWHYNPTPFFYSTYNSPPLPYSVNNAAEQSSYNLNISGLASGAAGSTGPLGMSGTAGGVENIRSRPRSAGQHVNSSKMCRSRSDSEKLSVPLSKLVADDDVSMKVSANVGTGWGGNKEFRTMEVHYDFEEFVSAELLIFYDDKRGLENRGINVKERFVTPNPFPNAFPDGCPDPINR